MPGRTETLSELEKRQRENRDANRKVLQELGLLEPLPPLLSAVRVKKRPAPEARPRPAKKARPPPPEEDTENGTGLTDGLRRSSRRSNKPVKFSSLDYGSDLEDDSDEDYYDERPRPRKPYTPRIRVAVPKNREKVYGAIPGVAVGTWWQTRLECCADGIHRPTVAGIHAGPDGAYSIALSGGYEDDLDWGECFTYTGEGGRNLKGTTANPKNLRTAPQSKDQELTRGNLALSRNVETRTPVRVIRGYKLRSPYAPEEGYRYDGLYWVEKFWLCPGQSGFLVYKYAMKRCEDQPPPPWTNRGAGDAASGEQPSDEEDQVEKEEEKEEEEEGDEVEEEEEEDKKQNGKEEQEEGQNGEEELDEQNGEAAAKDDVKGRKKAVKASGVGGKRGRRKKAEEAGGGDEAENEEANGAASAGQEE